MNTRTLTTAALAAVALALSGCSEETCGIWGETCCAEACERGLTCRAGYCADPADTCGAPGQACCPGGACYSALACLAGNRCGMPPPPPVVPATRTLASGQSYPYDLTVANGEVYWSTDTWLMKVPAGGGTPTQLAAISALKIHVAADASYVYYADPGYGVAGGAIARVPRNGGTRTTVMSSISPQGIAVDGTWLYAAYSHGGGSVVKMDKANATSTWYLAQGEGGPFRVAADATHVYWTSRTNGYVSRLPHGVASTAQRLASGQSRTAGIALDSSYVYWADEAGGAIRRVPKGGGTVTTLATGQSAPWSVATDGTRVYWSNSGDGTIRSVPVGGGSVTTHASGQGTVYGLAIDASNVYWGTYASSGAIRAIAK